MKRERRERVREREREKKKWDKFHGKREERENREKEQKFWIHFNVICVKYKEISWRVRRRGGGGKK